MKNISNILSAIVCCAACLACSGKLDAKPKLPKVVFEWGEPQVIAKGGYVRVHHMNDGRLMCTYTHGGNGEICYSSDGGDTWTTPEIVYPKFDFTNESGTTTVTVSNPETVQLSADNPYHPGRVIYCVNLRPSKNMSTVYPYSIAYMYSDDNGKSWSEPIVNYQSDRWDVNTLKGCWEPMAMELPDGRVQMYFSDETPYYRDGNKYQNISMFESSDGGDSWGPLRIVCYTPRFRDGMPVTLIYDGKIYLSIEANNVGVRLHPQVLYTTIEDNWSQTVGEVSDFRFDPFKESLESPDFTTGAPYLVQTENFFVISYQSSENADIRVANQRVMEVQACPKSEMKGNIFSTMRGASHPIDIDPNQESVMWNSLCPLGGDEIMACCQYNGQVTLVKGRIKLTDK